MQHKYYRFNDLINSTLGKLHRIVQKTGNIRYMNLQLKEDKYRRDRDILCVRRIKRST